MAMRAERAARREQPGVVHIQAEEADPSGRMVFEIDRVAKSFPGSRFRIQEFSARIMRGDRIGLIGPNGAGKTTLLRMLLGELPPDAGEVRHGANVRIAYYDQQREQLDPEKTVFATVGEGNDTVTANGRTRHVHAYLRDFLFTRERAGSPVKALSGGERNRLLLARLFTRSANVLVLDEPTNDLDLETLELLEAELVDWSGTLLLVSHDRAFLDNVVTSTFVFEADGRVQEYVGGYEDWLRQRRKDSPPPQRTGKPREKPDTPQVSRSTSNLGGSKKLSYNEQRELAQLPARIEALEAEQRMLNGRIAGPAFYKEGAEAIREALARSESIERELIDAYTRWEALESRATA
jgi:ATP-binding cassette subfamily F protein uup